jgi:ribonucleoside-diphosphate reductase alpha chain
LHWAITHGLSTPIATRAIAPAGSIGILGETTTGVEPIFCVAYKRRYLTEGKTWKYQYVVDPTAKRLIDSGINPSDIEDAYQLSYDVERRVAFQAWIQQFVDMGVSSTINLPYPITDIHEVEDFKKMLLNYLPDLRGITAYPDGARGGQPLVPSTYEIAVQHEGVVFEDDIDASCRNGVCGA